MFTISNFMRFVSLAVVFSLLKYTFHWFTIVTNVFAMEIDIVSLSQMLSVLFIIIIYRQGYSNVPTMTVVFFLGIILILFILLEGTITAFLNIAEAQETVYDFIYVNVRLKFTLHYKVYFMKNYLLLAYSQEALQFGRYYSIEDQTQFHKYMEHIDFLHCIPENSSLLTLKKNSHELVKYYLNYRLQQDTYLLKLKEMEDFHASGLYQSFVFVRNTIILLFVIPTMTSLYLSKILDTFFMDYILEKAICIVVKTITNYPQAYVILDMTPSEIQDFHRDLAVKLIQKVGVLWIYKNA